MNTLTRSTGVQLALALAIATGAAVLWFAAVPNWLTPLTYVVVVGLVTALAAVALFTYRSAQPTGSMAQLIHEADTADPATARRAPGASQSRHRS